MTEQQKNAIRQMEPHKTFTLIPEEVFPIKGNLYSCETFSQYCGENVTWQVPVKFLGSSPEPNTERTRYYYLELANIDAERFFTYKPLPDWKNC